MNAYDLRGSFIIHQSNGAGVEVNLQYPGLRPERDSNPVVELHGNARVGDNTGWSGMVSTNLEGRADENQFFLVVHWNQGSVGEYHGNFRILDQWSGRLSGVTFDRQHHESQATWFVDQDFRRIL